MKVLFYDYMQMSDAPSTLISADLSDKYTTTSVSVTLDEPRTFDCIGIGNTDATTITINSESITITDPSPYPDSYKNGLYLLDSSQTTDTVEIAHDGTYLGRLALGQSRSLGAAPAREPGFYSTNSDRQTLSMNTIPGAGGVTGRKIDVDFRYKFTEDMFRDIELAYPEQIGRGFPLFMIFDNETSRIPWERLYGKPSDKELLFQSSVNRFLYSRKFSFSEAY